MVPFCCVLIQLGVILLRSATVWGRFAAPRTVLGSFRSPPEKDVGDQLNCRVYTLTSTCARVLAPRGRTHVCGERARAPSTSAMPAAPPGGEGEGDGARLRSPRAEVRPVLTLAGLKSATSLATSPTSCQRTSSASSARLSGCERRCIATCTRQEGREVRRYEGTKVGR